MTNSDQPQLQSRPKSRASKLTSALAASLSIAMPTDYAVASREEVDVSSQQLQLTQLQTLDQRVADIGWDLSVNNLELCPEQFPATGLVLHTASQYAPKWRNAAIMAFAFQPKYPAVLAVAHGSAAWDAGVRPNDTIIELNGIQLKESTEEKETDSSQYSSTDRVMTILENLPYGQQFLVKLARGDNQFVVTINPRPGCAARFEVAPANTINASSNGKIVQVFSKLVVILKKDSELALVMGHELAHNVLKHRQIKSERRLSTGLLSIWTGTGRSLRDFEREADRYGIFLSARAGYDYADAPDFWSRFASIPGLGAWIATTHPTPSNRKKNAKSAVDELDGLKMRGEPLIPSEKIRAPNSNETSQTRRPAKIALGQTWPQTDEQTFYFRTL